MEEIERKSLDTLMDDYFKRDLAETINQIFLSEFDTDQRVKSYLMLPLLHYIRTNDQTSRQVVMLVDHLPVYNEDYQTKFWSKLEDLPASFEIMLNLGCQFLSDNDKDDAGWFMFVFLLNQFVFQPAEVIQCLQMLAERSIGWNRLASELDRRETFCEEDLHSRYNGPTSKPDLLRIKTIQTIRRYFFSCSIIDALNEYDFIDLDMITLFFDQRPPVFERNLINILREDSYIGDEDGIDLRYTFKYKDVIIDVTCTVNFSNEYPTVVSFEVTDHELRKTILNNIFPKMLTFDNLNIIAIIANKC